MKIENLLPDFYNNENLAVKSDDDKKFNICRYKLEPREECLCTKVKNERNKKRKETAACECCVC